MKTFGKGLRCALAASFVAAVSPVPAQSLPDNVLYKSDDLLIMDPHMNVKRADLGANMYMITCPSVAYVQIYSRTGAAIVDLYAQGRDEITRSLEGLLAIQNPPSFRQSMPHKGLGIIDGHGNVQAALSHEQWIGLRRAQLAPGGEQGSSPTDPRLIQSLRKQVALTCAPLS